MIAPCEDAMRSGLFEFHDVGNGCGEAAPVGGFFFEMFSAEPRERIELGAPIIFSWFPFGSDPPFLLELVKGGIERAVADLENIAGDLFEALADGVAIQRFEGKNLEKE
jgi:hypothetical protein